MGFWGWFWLIVIVVVGCAILQSWAQGQQHQEQATALAKIPDFSPAVVHKGLGGGAGLAIDPTANKFAVSYGASNTKVFSFGDLVAVEVLRNGSSLQKTNRGSQVAGAAVGAVLLGPVGLLVGGLTGSKRAIEKVDRLSLKIFTNDLVQPVHEVVFFDIKGTKPESFAVKHASQELDAWHGRLQTILHMRSQSA